MVDETTSLPVVVGDGIGVDDDAVDDDAVDEVLVPSNPVMLKGSRFEEDVDVVKSVVALLAVDVDDVMGVVPPPPVAVTFEGTESVVLKMLELVAVPRTEVVLAEIICNEVLLETLLAAVPRTRVDVVF